jgi:hypothetical protein
MQTADPPLISKIHTTTLPSQISALSMQSDRKYCHLNSLIPPRPSNPPRTMQTHRRRNQPQTAHSEHMPDTCMLAQTLTRTQVGRPHKAATFLLDGRGLSRGIQGKGFQHTVAVLMTPPLDPSRAMARDTAFTTKSCNSKATMFTHQLGTLGFTRVTCSAAAKSTVLNSHDATPISRVD